VARTKKQGIHLVTPEEDPTCYVCDWNTVVQRQNHDYDLSIVNVTPETHGAEDYHAPVLDYGLNDADDIQRFITCAKKIGGKNGEVLVHCHAGISRSPLFITVSLYFADETKGFDEAKQSVKDEYKAARVNPGLERQVKQGLANLEVSR